jgi:hypothetical protein
MSILPPKPSAPIGGVLDGYLAAPGKGRIATTVSKINISPEQLNPFAAARRARYGVDLHSDVARKADPRAPSSANGSEEIGRPGRAPALRSSVAPTMQGRSPLNLFSKRWRIRGPLAPADDQRAWRASHSCHRGSGHSQRPGKARLLGLKVGVENSANVAHEGPRMFGNRDGPAGDADEVLAGERNQIGQLT